MKYFFLIIIDPILRMFSHLALILVRYARNLVRLREILNKPIESPYYGPIVNEANVDPQNIESVTTCCQYVL